MLRVFKLLNGEEIFGHVIPEHIHKDEVEITNPMMVEQAYKPTGEPYIVLTAYIPFAAEGSTVIKQDMIVTSFECDREMTKFYNNSLRRSKERVEVTKKELKQANQQFAFDEAQRENMVPIKTKIGFYIPYSRALH